MADPHPPTQTEASVEKIERDNEEAFNRLKHLVCNLRVYLGDRLTGRKTMATASHLPAINGVPKGADVTLRTQTFLRLIRAGFSEEEWAALSGRADFLSRMHQAASIDEVEAVIQFGAELVEGVSSRPQMFAGLKRST